MKILQIASPAMPIPPPSTGGTERVVYALLQELARAGHQVTLLGENTSQPPAGVAFQGIGTYWHREHTLRLVWQHLARYGGDYDVIHNHGRLLFYLPRLWGRAAKVQTWHSGDLLVPQMKKFLSLRPAHFAFAPCGNWIAEEFRSLGGQWVPIHNGLPLDLYQPNFNVGDDAPLVIIGRMDPRKGFVDAIRVAKKTGRRLFMAGPIGDQPHEKAWFEENIRRHCDGKRIQYLGPVNDREKQDLLSQAAAFLLPLKLSEAFGLVMIEAFACGCPVIAYNRYSVPEVIREGFNGFLAEDETDMIRKVGRIQEIERRSCRQDFEDRFTSKTMVGKYLDLYRRLGAEG